MLTHHQRAGETALSLGQGDRLDALRAALRLAVLTHQRSLAVTVVGDHQQVHIVAGDIHRDHLALRTDIHPLDAARAATH